MRQLDDLTPAEIKTAVAALMPGQGGTQSHQLAHAVAKHLDSSLQAVPQGWSGTKVINRYASRLKRALDLLAGDGVIVKVPAGHRLPSGESQGMREVRYYTPEGFAAAKEEGEKRRAEALAVEARWDVVRRRLGAVDVNLRPNGSLYLVDWEHLLEATGL